MEFPSTWMRHHFLEILLMRPSVNLLEWANVSMKMLSNMSPHSSSRHTLQSPLSSHCLFVFFLDCWTQCIAYLFTAFTTRTWGQTTGAFVRCPNWGAQRGLDTTGHTCPINTVVLGLNTIHFIHTNKEWIGKDCLIVMASHYVLPLVYWKWGHILDFDFFE